MLDDFLLIQSRLITIMSKRDGKQFLFLLYNHRVANKTEFSSAWIENYRLIESKMVTIISYIVFLIAFILASLSLYIALLKVKLI